MSEGFCRRALFDGPSLTPRVARSVNTEVLRLAVISTLLTCVKPAEADEIESLIESSRIDCHDENTETRLDFTKLDRDVEDSDTFRAWVTIVDRIRKGEMPPAIEPETDMRCDE